MSSSETSRASRTPVMREVPAPGAAVVARGGRLRVDLNAGWRFVRDEESARGSSPADRNGHVPTFESLDAAELVNLPHSVRLDPLNASGGRNFQGVCWYARELRVREEWRGRIVYLHFEGAMHIVDV
ncbi:MAG: hypothetical protein H7Z14_21870, partial [Anaerolineae bacterium]|nr:hypothetical protein [Phycisphaerae bacterium]